MLNGLKKMANISDKEKEKLLSNKWLQSFAKDLNLKCTCSNCRLYNRGKCHCKFDDSIIDNPNVLDTYCEWWVPEKWILDKYKKKYPHFRMWGIDWVKDTADLRCRKEWIKKQEEGEKIIEFCDKPAVVDNTDFASNELSPDGQYCNQTSNNNSENDKKYKTLRDEMPIMSHIMETYLGVLFNQNS